MNNSNQQQKLKLIQHETMAAKALLETLENEFLALNERATPEEITNIAKQKERELIQMEQASLERTSLIDPSDPQLEREPLRSAWHALLKLAQGCQRQNQINGCIINSAQRHAEQAIAILHGQNPDAGVGYGSSGKAISDRQGRSLAKA